MVIVRSTPKKHNEKRSGEGGHATEAIGHRAHNCEVRDGGEGQL